MSLKTIRERAREKPPEGLLKQDFYDTAIADRKQLLGLVDEMVQESRVSDHALSEIVGALLEERDEVMDLQEKIKSMDETLTEVRRLKSCSNSAASRWQKENERLRETAPTLIVARWQPKGNKDKPWALYRNNRRPHTKSPIARVKKIPWLEVPKSGQPKAK